MKTCRRVFLLSFLAILCFGLLGQNESISAEPADGKDGKKIVFQWAFCALRKADSGPQISVITRDTALKSGDQVKFFVRLENPGFLYLIYQSSLREMSVLFPRRFKQLESRDTMSGKHYIPESNRWFELDEHAGQERFYLLASTQRLFDLEALINQYERVDKATKSELAEKIISEIRNLRKRYLKFKTYAEKPVTIIGNLRGAEQTKGVQSKDIAAYAVEISTTTFFSRTYTIDHRQE
ncbi:MAG: DUF4384 domain-containing protein [Desulfobacterales bacterium]